MTETRRIVLILGNGFDLDLGLKTSYKDFWESEFCPKDYPAPLIKYLDEKTSSNREEVRWYDLEKELLNYGLLQKDSAIDDVITVREQEALKHINETQLRFGIANGYEKEVDSLCEKGLIIFTPVVIEIPYKKALLQSANWRDREAFTLIKNGLEEYLKQIKHRELAWLPASVAVLSSAMIATEKGEDVSIFSFNYTPLPNQKGYPFEGMMHYVHGSCSNGNIIIGTRDDIEIPERYDFLYKSFDPHYNPPQITTALRSATDVVVFGHSLGINDQNYFRDYFNEQIAQRDTVPHITIFTKDAKSEIDVRRSLNALVKDGLSALCTRSKFRIIQTEGIKGNNTLLHEYLDDILNDPGAVEMLLQTMEPIPGQNGGK